MKDFRFKTWHFVLLLIIMFVSTNILGHLNVNALPAEIDESHCIEINHSTFSEALSSGINYILLYKENSSLCNKMEHNLKEFAKTKNEKIKFYKLDIDQYPGQYSKYNISGVPNVLVFKDGEEMERIMGIVPVSNLEIIHSRILK